MPRQLTQTRALRTRAALLRAGRAEFAARGWEGATSKSIAARAGMATGTFYRYFTDKGVLLREVASLRLAELAEPQLYVLERAAADVDKQATLRAMMVEQLRTRREQAGLDDVLRGRRYQDRELQAHWAAGEQRVVARLAVLLREWGAGPDPEALATVLYGLVDGSMEAQLAHPLVSDDRFLDALALSGVRLSEPPAESP